MGCAEAANFTTTTSKLHSAPCKAKVSRYEIIKDTSAQGFTRFAPGQAPYFRSQPYKNSVQSQRHTDTEAITDTSTPGFTRPLLRASSVHCADRKSLKRTPSSLLSHRPPWINVIFDHTSTQYYLHWRSHYRTINPV